MRWFRKACGAAAAVALGAGLVACSGGADGEAGGDGGGKVTLTVATFNEFGYEELFTEYMDANPNVTIEHKKAATSEEARTNLNTRLAAGSGLSDIEAIEADWWPEMKEYSDQFVDLTDPAVEGRWVDWKTADATTEDGKLLGYGTDIGPQAVCYRADLFEKAGLPTDRQEVAELLDGDWQNYFDNGKKFVEATDIPWYDSATPVFQGMVNQIPQPYENEDGSVKPLAENTEIKAAYDNTIQASTTDGLSAGYEQWSEDWVAGFQNDGFATMLCPAWMVGVIEGNAAGVEGWDVAPVYPGGGSNWGGSYLTVPAQGENQEEAQKLAAWLTAPEQQIKAFEAKGTFPSQKEALEDPVLKESTNEFFNGAPTGEIFAAQAEAIEQMPYKGKHFFSIHTTINDGIIRVDVAKSSDAAASWDQVLADVEALGIE